MEELEAFITYLKEVKQSSGNTVQSYRRDLDKMIHYLLELGVQSVNHISETNMNSYLLFLENEGRAASTISRSLASAKAFFLYLMKERKMDHDPLERIRGPKIPKKAAEILTQNELNALLEQPDPNTLVGKRDKAMLELLYATGVRVSELITLKLANLNLNVEYVIVEGEKGDRIIPFGKQAKQALQYYLKDAREYFLNGQTSEFLFINRYGEVLSRQGLWKVLKKYKEKAYIEKEITPHSIRHAFSAHLLDGGADICSVQELLGYAPTSMTQNMMRGSKHIREVYRRAHPRA